jgi:hypothetical protein
VQAKLLLDCVIPSQSGDFAGKKSIFDVSRQKSRKQAQLAYHCIAFGFSNIMIG